MQYNILINMLKIGVTGSNGFIGWHLCNTLLLDKKKFLVIEFNRKYFEDDSKIDDFISKCDIVIHLAGLNRHNDDHVIYNTNVGIAQKLINSLLRTKFKGLLLFSSSIQEERNNSFGNSKKVARELFSNWANESKGYFKGLIIPNVYGPFGVPYYNSVVSTFCHQVVNNETPKVETNINLRLIYINDLIKELILQFDSETNAAIKIKHTDEYKVTDILELLNEYKNRYFEKGEIPRFKSNFEINLFNTFRSYFDLSNHFPIKYKNNIDERGNFVEIIRQEEGGQVSFSTTKKGITRGNHFHTRKIERFSVIKGKALIQLRKIGSSEIFNYHLTGEEPAYVDMPVWYTHNIINIGEDDLYTIFWINEFYNVSDPDTFFEIV